MSSCHTGKVCVAETARPVIVGPADPVTLVEHHLLDLGDRNRVMGKVAGLVRERLPAGKIVESMVEEAAELLEVGGKSVAKL